MTDGLKIAWHVKITDSSQRCFLCTHTANWLSKSLILCLYLVNISDHFLRRYSCSGIVLIWKFSFKHDLQDLDVAFRTCTVFLIFYAATGFAAVIFLFSYVFEQCFAVFVLSFMKRGFMAVRTFGFSKIDHVVSTTRLYSGLLYGVFL